ncbi:related to Catalase [Phialocephala subalpina]|uniref:Catalase n=1 Tax=Phialocephala subalpina TaxID=576137 RepID=A0A1L7XCL5_9HELO|nr:related to Catalase [Phialocephala subalpina]
MKLLYLGGCLILASVAQSQSPKQEQLSQYLVDTRGQTETTDTGVIDNTTTSLRTGPRGYVLLEDTINRKKMLHFDRERAPERVVHALGHAAYGTFTSYGDWSNITSACWLKANTTSDVFTRFSVVVAGTGGADTGRDTHGFATKIYSECGNQDLVGNHVPSFFITDGALFPDLVHAVKAEPDKGFPTGGSAHTTAYDFFTQNPEGAEQLMAVLSDMGIPRDTRHIAGNGVHTYRFINVAGKSTLFKWYWKPMLGYRAMVYDEATKIAGKNNNFQRIDLWNSIEAGMFPEWEFMVQIFPDDGQYRYKGIDLLDPTQVVPFELNAPIALGKLQLNKNPTNYFAETESVSFAPSNVVDGVSFVPDPLLQWRLMSYDDTATHRHNSPNGYLLPVNRPVVPINNNYRDGYMQPQLFKGPSDSSPDGIGGVQPSSVQDNLAFYAENVSGTVGRYEVMNDPFTQARALWFTMDQYAQQHTVDAYRFELGHVSDPNVTARYISKILNPINNCLARRVAYGVGSPMPAIGSGSSAVPNATYPSLFPLGSNTSMPVTGLMVGILSTSDSISASTYDALTSVLKSNQVLFEVVASHLGPLASGIIANQSYVTTSSIFYDAIIIVSGSPQNSSIVSMTEQGFVQEAFGHGKPIGEVGTGFLTSLSLGGIGTFVDGSAGNVVNAVIGALETPGRYPQRQPLDDVGTICG